LGIYTEASAVVGTVVLKQDTDLLSKNPA
jgi:hypothetical protein